MHSGFYPAMPMSVAKLVAHVKVPDEATVEVVVEKVGLDKAIWTEVVTKCGEKEPNMMIIAGLRNEDWRAAILDMNLKATDKVKLNILVNKIRQLLEVDISDIYDKGSTAVAEPAPHTPLKGIKVANAPGKDEEPDDKPRYANQPNADPDDLPVRQYFDQLSKAVVRAAPPRIIEEMRKRWDCDPQPNRRPTDEQLSVVWALAGLGKNCLAGDMGVLAPNQLQREHYWTFTEHFRGADGRWTTKEIPGPSDLADWIEAWEFATVVMVMAHILRRSTMDTYKDWFKNL